MTYRSRRSERLAELARRPHGVPREQPCGCPKCHCERVGFLAMCRDCIQDRHTGAPR